jgi:hypothetical protein
VQGYSPLKWPPAPLPGAATAIRRAGGRTPAAAGS